MGMNIDDFDLEVDAAFSDDDLPPAASQAQRSRTRSQPPSTSAHILGDGQYANAAQAESSSSSRPIAAATDAFRDLLSGTRDHATWFKHLDDEYIKPKLLLDQGSGSGSPSGSGRKGPDAV